jgi:hypothetical protein
MSIRIRQKEEQPNDKVDIHPKGQGYCSDCNHLYYNITIAHKPSEQYTRATYKKNNTEPILFLPHHYSLAITRFSIGTGTLPILIAESLTENSNILAYSFSIGFNGEHKTVYMEVENPALITVDIQTKYFYYTYSRFLKAVNKALKDAYADAVATIIGFPISEPPLITFDPVTKLFTITAPTAEYTEGIGPPIEVFMNAKAEALFSSWDTINYFNIGGFNGQDQLAYRIRFYDKGNNIEGDYYKIEQDYEMLTRWNSFKSLQITSNLPIQNEFIENDYASLDSGKTTNQNILKDYIVLYQEGSSVARTTIDYTNKELEYIDLKGVEPIRNIEVSVFWVDQNGKQYPLYLSNNETVLIKLLFKNKEQFY